MSQMAVELHIRQMLLTLAAFILLGTPVELLLQDHTEESIQWIPFILCALGLISIAAALLRPGRNSLLALRVIMTLVAAGGLLGMSLHLLGNFEFEQEIRPNAPFVEVAQAALKGANPLLAPGILVFTSMVAWIATYSHPALGKRDRS
jgi:hypothetical protein